MSDPALLPAQHHLGSAWRQAARRRHLPDCRPEAAHNNALFSHAFLINVDHSTSGERLSLMASQLNSSCVEWSLWPGVLPSNQSFVEHGHLLPRNVRSDRSRFDAILAEPRSRAMLGNYLSHATLWAHLLAQAAAAKREEAWLIMEDDVWLAPQWTALLAGGVARVPTRLAIMRDRRLNDCRSQRGTSRAQERHARRGGQPGCSRR